MSSNSNPPFPAANSSDNSSLSVTDLISYLKTSFHDSEFSIVEQILTSREDSLKQSNSELESTYKEKLDKLTTKVANLESLHQRFKVEHQEVTFRKLELEDECQRCRRESEGLRKEIVRLEEEKKRMVDRETSMEEKCRSLEEEVEGLEKEKKEMVDRERRMEESRRSLKEEIEGLEKEKRERIAELVGRNTCLTAEKRRVESEVEKVRGEVEEGRRREREKEDELREFVERNRCLELDKEKMTAELEGNMRLFEELSFRVSTLEKDASHLLGAADGTVHVKGGGGLVGKSVQGAGNSVSVAKKPARHVTIDISDSDDSDDQMTISNALKRKRTHLAAVVLDG
ncbi:hypothetical protein Dimus_007191 [Dionaea muscipula]